MNNKSGKRRHRKRFYTFNGTVTLPHTYILGTIARIPLYLRGMHRIVNLVGLKKGASLYIKVKASGSPNGIDKQEDVSLPNFWPVLYNLHADLPPKTCQTPK